MKIMIDTDVVLDVLLRREPFFQASYEVMKRSALEQVEGFVCATAATDIYDLLRRALPHGLYRHAKRQRLQGLAGQSP